MDFDIVIETDDAIVDMKTGLDTMQGASEVVRIVAETAVTGTVPSRKSHRSSVRTNLKKSFKGSYGHTFSLDFYDAEKKQKFVDIGESAFMEVMSYLIADALYLEEHPPMSSKAAAVIDSFGDNYDHLLSKLRQSPLTWMHKSPANLNVPVKLRYRESDKSKKVIARLDRTTARSLDTKANDKRFPISACITRFNINTGNGRLLVKGEGETVPFSIAIPYRDVKLESKKLFSKNLDNNNGISDNNAREYLTLKVKKVTNYGGHVVKYIVVGL